MPLRSKAIYTRLANAALSILWVGALVLLMAMLYNWKNTQGQGLESFDMASRTKGIFVDQLLLSSQDLQLEKGANLINLSLKKDVVMNEPEQDSVLDSATHRKLLYSKILKSKIKEISAAPAADNKDGFIIKPLPE